MTNTKSELEVMFEENTLIENPQNFLWDHILKHHSCADVERLMEVLTTQAQNFTSFEDYQFFVEQIWGMYRLSREMQRYQLTGKFYAEMPPLAELL